MKAALNNGRGVSPSLIQPGLNADVSKTANLQQSSSVTQNQVNHRQDFTKNHTAPSHHPIVNEANGMDLIQKNPRVFMMENNATTFETTSEGPVEASVSCDPPPKRQNSGGGDDQHQGKKHRSESQNNNHTHTGKNGGNNGDGDSENGNASNPNDNPRCPKKFACPMYKRDPEKYKRCANCVLTTWARVLQHLKRVHYLEGEHCANCRVSFDGKDSEALKNAHNRQGPCQLVNFTRSGILIDEDYNKLKNIRASSDEVKWNEAWDRLFPHLETPSAFSETHLEFILRIAWPTCMEFLQRAQGHSDLASLAAEFADTLTRTPTPAPRVVGDNAAQAGVLQAQDVAPATASAPTILNGSHSWALSASRQATPIDPDLMMPLPDSLPPSQPPQQVPTGLPLGVESAQQPFNTDAFQSGLPPQNPRDMGLQPSSVPSQDMTNTDLVDDFSEQPNSSIPQTSFSMEETLQGIGSSFLYPIMIPSGSYAQDENGTVWAFLTIPLQDPGNRGSGSHS